MLFRNETPTNWWGRQNTMPQKLDQKPFFRTSRSAIPEVADNVISGTAEEWFGVDVRNEDVADKER